MSEYNENFFNDDEQHRQNEHRQESEHHHDEHFNEADDHHERENNQPSAPTDDNGYIFVPPTPQSSIDSSAVHHTAHHPSAHEDINRIIDELASNTDNNRFGQVYDKIVAEADSSTSSQQPQQPARQEETTKPTTKTQKEEKNQECSSNSSFLCPYYLLACDKLSKVEVPPRARDLLLWRDPKVTGAVFGSILVLLISLASFSLFTVIGSLSLLALASLGAYRFYLALVFRIKGTYDDTFDKLSQLNVSLPKERVQRLIYLLENDFNRGLNKLKSILLWDSISNSVIAFIGFYLVYCLGSWFNTLTLLILIHVSVFTLPKVYQVYKQPIDQAIEKFTSCCHQGVKQVMAKLPPFLQAKKKTQ